MVLKNRTLRDLIARGLPLFLQLTRFGIVGLTAATIHFCIVVLLVEMHWLQPLVANIAAFCVSVQASYWGHRTWTFSGTTQRHAVAFRRLLVVSIVAFVLNESMFYMLISQYKLPYPLALFIVLSVLPLIVFTVNKIWVFE